MVSTKAGNLLDEPGWQSNLLEQSSSVSNTSRKPPNENPVMDQSVQKQVKPSENLTWKGLADVAHEYYIEGQYNEALKHLIALKREIAQAPKDVSSLFVEADADFLIAAILHEKNLINKSLELYNRALQSYRDIIIICAASRDRISIKRAASEKVCMTLTCIADALGAKREWNKSLQTSEDALDVFDEISKTGNQNSNFVKLEERILNQIDKAEEMLGIHNSTQARRRGDPKIINEINNSIAEPFLWLENFVRAKSDDWFKSIDKAVSSVLDE